MNRRLLTSPFASAALVAGLISAAGLRAQPASSPASSTSTEPETVTLSPFDVSAETDRGYIATRASGATKTNTPMIELPHSIQVLNSEFIADTGSQNVFQAARYVSNVAGGDQRGDDAILIRGFAATRLRNGQPFPTGNAFTFEEMAAFDRVEIIKGASAVLYGSSSPGGLINLVDKKPLAKEQGSLSLTGGSYDFYKAVADVTGPLVKLGDVAVNYRAIATWEDSESWRKFVFRRRAYFNGSLDFRLTHDTSVLTRVEYQRDNLLDSYGKPYIWFNTANQGFLLNVPDDFFRGDPSIDKKRVARFRWETTLEHHFNENWTFRGSVVYHDDFASRTEVFISAQSATLNLFPRFAQYIPNDQQVLIGEGDLTGKFKVGPTQHQLLAGYNYQDIKVHDSNIRYNVAPDPLDIYNPQYYVTTLGTEVTSTRRVAYTTSKWDGYFVQDQMGVFGDKLQFIAGVRRDVLKQNVQSFVTGVTTPNNQKKTSPRYGVLWRVIPQVSLYGSYNESFTPASGAGSVQGIPFPSPTAKQKEVGAKFELFNSKLFGGVSYFENIRYNQTTVDVLNPGFSVATGEITSKGSELDLGVQVTPAWQIIGSVGFEHAKITKDNTPANVGLEQFNVPNQMASMWTKYDFRSGPLKNLSIGTGVTYVGERAGQRDSVVRSFALPAYTVVNGLISYKTGVHKFALNIENLFDRRYITIGSARLANPGEHRGFRLTYTFGF